MAKRIKEPVQWKSVPMAYRHCLASRRHELDLMQGGNIRGVALQWFRCELCGMERLTARDPQGNVEHLYAPPEGYKMPEGFTSDDWREWLYYEAQMDIQNVPSINPNVVEEIFGKVFS